MVAAEREQKTEEEIAHYLWFADELNTNRLLSWAELSCEREGGQDFPIF